MVLRSRNPVPDAALEIAGKILVSKIQVKSAKNISITAYFVLNMVLGEKQNIAFVSN
jgi:hypothetical protein